MRLGVVGNADDARGTAGLVERAGGTAVEGDAASVLDAEPSAVVALGESALLDLVRAGVAVPVLPVDAGRGVRSVPGDSLERALRRVVDGDWSASTRRTLSVSVGGREAATALMDVMLITSEPARISEYRVDTPARPVSRFRADGVVVATPQGSHGYCRNLDGPLLAPETDALAVVPVAPFAINHQQWVLDMDGGVTLSVARDEGAVSLFADDAEVRRIEPGERVEVVADGELALVETAEGGPIFGRE